MVPLLPHQVSHSYCPPSDSSSPNVPAAGLARAPPPPLDVVVVGRRMPLADVAVTPRACLCVRTVVQPIEVREGGHS